MQVKKVRVSSPQGSIQQALQGTEQTQRNGGEDEVRNIGTVPSSLNYVLFFDEYI